MLVVTLILWLMCGLMVIIWLVSLYFINFNLEKHPLLIKKTEKVLYDICDVEKISVFHVPFEILNKNNNCESRINGRYIYLLLDDNEKLEDIKMEIRELEVKYGKSFNQICKENNINTDLLNTPRIELLDNIKTYEYLELYYCTFFHELGHHFLVKNNEIKDHTEKDADDYAVKLIKEHLPKYFQLFFIFKYRFEKNGLILSKKEKLLALFEFLGYMKEKRKFDKSLKQNNIEIHIQLGNHMDEINCVEITNDDIKNMD